MSGKLRRSAAFAGLICVALAVGLAVVGAQAVGGAAPASQVTCGDTITADTTLQTDLVSCPNNGLVIGADGITLDLNGHTVSGNGEPVQQCGRGEFCDFGVLNNGHDGITMRDGSVRGFGAGVFVGRARQNLVLRISSSRNQFFGFVISESARTVVRRSSGNRNPDPDGDGIGVFGSRHVRVVRNSFRRNALGVHVEDSTNLLINRNRFSRNSGPGVLMEADRNQVRRNRFLQNGAGIIVAPGNRNVLARNRLIRDGEGVAIENGHGNLAARNVVVRARGVGIRLGIERPPIGGAKNVVRGNLVIGSGDDGFLVTKNDRRSVLRGNVAIVGGEDGFDIESRSARLASNQALRNADLGIEAVFGVINGGGNIARRNGDPRQCTNIVCN